MEVTLIETALVGNEMQTHPCTRTKPVPRLSNPRERLLTNFFMNWYYKVLGGHTHVRVFMNGEKCGDLVFRNEEFQAVRLAYCDCDKVQIWQPNKGPLPFINFLAEESV